MTTRTLRRNGTTTIATLAAALCAAVALTACGGASKQASATASSSTKQPSSFLATAEKQVSAARRALTKFAGPTESAGKPPVGKTIVSIYSVPAPFPTRAAKSVVAAGKAVGWQVKVVNGRGTPEGWAAAVDTAITSGASAIVFTAGAPSLIAPQIKRAQRAGIPFVSIAGCDPHPPDGVVAQINPSETDAGYRLGQWVVAHSPNGAKVLALDSPEFACLKQDTAGFKNAIADAGSGYSIVQTAQSPVTDITTSSGAQRLAAMMRAHPDVKYFWTMSESWAPTFAQATQAAGRTDVTGIGTDGDFFVPQIAKGSKFVIAAPDTLEDGWYAVDALIRWFNHKPQVTYRLPFRIVDAGNAASVAGAAVNNDFDFAGSWNELWGTAK